MKAIHITSDLELELPKPLNEMFLKTSKLGIVHISYKMPCWVHDDNLNNIKKKFSEICKELQPYTIEFDRYKITKSSDYTIMIGAKERANPLSVQQKFLDGINDLCEAHIKSIYAKYFKQL